MLITSRNPENITKSLTRKYKFELIGTGPTKFHLGCDYKREEHSTLWVGPRKYINKMVTKYESAVPEHKFIYLRYKKCPEIPVCLLHTAL